MFGEDEKFLKAFELQMRVIKKNKRERDSKLTLLHITCSAAEGQERKAP